MRRVVILAGVLGVWATGGVALAQRRPPIDESAMRDAIRATASAGESYSSPASYSHFLRSRLLHHSGEHARSVDELLLALVTDEANPYLRVALAEEYARLGDLRRCEKTLRRVIDTHPRYAPAHLLLGRIFTEQRRVAAARNHLRRAIKLVPSEAEGYLGLAQVELEAGRPDAAIAAMEAMSQVIRDDSRGFRLLGTVFAEKGDRPRAEKMLRRAIEVFPGDHDAWTRLAQIHESNDRHVEAEAAYAEALQRDPDNFELLLAAGRTSLRIKADARARAWFARAVSLSDAPETAVRVAFAYLSEDYVKDAVQVLDDARKRAGASEPRLSFYAALMHEKLRDFRRAAVAYEAVPKGSELYDEARIRRAGALSMGGRHKQALELFRTVHADRPELVALYPLYARALERSGANKEAERVIRAALKRLPSSELYGALAENLERQGRREDATRLLEGALDERPGDVGLRFQLGAVYERSGAPDDALAQMRRILLENPDNPAALNFVGYVLADHGRELDEAERMVKRALELKPDSGAFLDSLGWVYFRRGDIQKAVEVLERAVKLEPDEPEIIEHLGDAYQQADRRAEAQQMYRRALEALSVADEPVNAPALRSGLERKLKILSTESAGR